MIWDESHQDIKEYRDLIEEMARELQEKKILGVEYFEEILFTSTL